MSNKELDNNQSAHEQASQTEQTNKIGPCSTDSQFTKKHDLSLPSGSPLLIKSKTQHIKELMNKGYLKIRVNIPDYKKLKQNNIIGVDLSTKKSKAMLVPDSYTIMQLTKEIRTAYKINEKQAIYLFINNKKIPDAGSQLKTVYDKQVQKTGGQGIGILELNVRTNDPF